LKQKFSDGHKAVTPR